uniref:Uncharacterized protein n=1 Tax=Tanacetum cinerariifolium TaxID=118510 RepID=A0A699H441_TANCI|nr:hypothetical protein [Tanacetum cinerariifolium]
MDTLIEVLEYLNNLKAYLDDGDSSETRIDGQDAWDAELDFAYSHNYITYEMLGKLGFMRLDYGNYGRRMVKEVRMKIHGFNFLVDFMVIDYANECKPSIVCGRDFLENILEALDRKYKELEEQKPTIEVLENYMVYRKKLDEPFFLVLDISVDKELLILLGRPFLRTCGAIINVGLGTMTIDDGVIHYFPKPRAKAYLENFNVDKDWLGCFEVKYDKDGNHVGNKMLKTFLLPVKKFPLLE